MVLWWQFYKKCVHLFTVTYTGRRQYNSDSKYQVDMKKTKRHVASNIVKTDCEET